MPLKRKSRKAESLHIQAAGTKYLDVYFSLTVFVEVQDRLVLLGWQEEDRYPHVWVESYPLVINVGVDLSARRRSPPARKTEVNEPTGSMIYDKLAHLLAALRNYGAIFFSVLAAEGREPAAPQLLRHFSSL